jgi:transposase
LTHALDRIITSLKIIDNRAFWSEVQRIMTIAAYRRHDISDNVWNLREPHLPGREGIWGRRAKDVTSGAVADCTQAATQIQGLSAGLLLADRGYDSNAIVALVQKQGMKAVIPPRKNRKGVREYDLVSCRRPDQMHRAMGCHLMTTLSSSGRAMSIYYPWSLGHRKPEPLCSGYRDIRRYLPFS